jgi:type VI secretion system protein ImpA
MIFCCSSLQTSGLPGFRDGLQYLSGLLQQFWPSLYPLLDPDDNNDPTQRLNILSALTAPRGSIGSWLRFIDYLYTAPLGQPSGAAPITFDALTAAKQAQTTGSSGELAKVEAALRHAPPEELGANNLALQQALELVRGLDTFLTSSLGARAAIDFELLETTLAEMQACLQPALSGAPPSQKGQTATPSSLAPAESGTLTVSGSVRSRQDVVRAIDLICEYYRQVEPSSPVPFLLRRAQKLATMDFVQAVQELNLGSLDALRPSMGSALEGLAPPAPPAAGSVPPLSPPAGRAQEVSAGSSRAEPPTLPQLRRCLLKSFS